jgi:hypothetical protein
VSETFNYTFTDGVTGLTDSFDVTVATPATDSTGDGDSYTVTAISGSLDGGLIAVGPELGAQGAITNDGTFIYDNAIFTTAGTGDTGNTNGIDLAGLLFNVGGQEYNLYTNNGSFILVDGANTGAKDVLTLTSTDAPCFCAGTMILTDRGEVAVEELNMGDHVVTHTGAVEAIRWIGRRAVASRFADPMTAMPVRIAAGAIADQVPTRDVLLSPCHAVLVDGILAEAGALVNSGVNSGSISRESAMAEVFTYYHIELASHALIMVDGMAAETFVDNVDRMGFDNWAEHEALFGDSVTIIEMDAPRARSARQVPATTRARLAARAGLNHAEVQAIAA